MQRAEVKIADQEPCLRKLQPHLGKAWLHAGRHPPGHTKLPEGNSHHTPQRSFLRISNFKRERHTPTFHLPTDGADSVPMKESYKS